MTASPTDPFLEYIGPILALEGGLTDTPGDNGGVTNFGVTEATAHAAGYSGTMAAMTQAEAEAIYRTVYWTAPGFDRIDPLLPGLAEFMLEVGINMGPSTVSEFLQRALNVMGNQATLYPLLDVDGACGALTRAALASYLAVRAADDGVLVLMGVMRALVVNYYIAIGEADQTQQAFMYGWLRTRGLGL